MQRIVTLDNGEQLVLPPASVVDAAAPAEAQMAQPTMQQLRSVDLWQSAGVGAAFALTAAALLWAAGRLRSRLSSRASERLAAARASQDAAHGAVTTPTAAPAPTIRRERDGRLASLFLLLVVVGAAQVVHHTWPFYAMDMFSYAPTGGSRLIVVQADGRAREPTRFVDYRCDPMPTDYVVPNPEVCGTWNSIEVHDRRSFFWILRHQRSEADDPASPGAGARHQPLLLARRIERFDAEGGRERVDCPITLCSAREADR